MIIPLATKAVSDSGLAADLVDVTYLPSRGAKHAVSVVNRRRLPPYADWSNHRIRGIIEDAMATSAVTVIFDATEELIADCRRCGAKVRKIHLYNCHYTHTHNVIEGWGKKARYNIRRSRALLEQVGALEVRMMAGPEVGDTSFGRFADLLSQAAVDRRQITTKWSMPTYRHLLRAVVTVPGSFLFELSCGGQVVAAAQCNVLNGHLIYMIPTYDATYSKYSPGALLLLEIAEYCSANGLVLDLGKGAADYKSRIAQESYPLYVAVVAGSALGNIMSSGVALAILGLVNMKRLSKGLAKAAGSAR